MPIQVAGDLPVYVFVSGRYTRETGLADADRWIPDDEFCRHVLAALSARWRSDRTGRVKRVTGVVLWDGNARIERTQVPAFEDRIAHQLQLLFRLTH